MSEAIHSAEPPPKTHSEPARHSAPVEAPVIVKESAEDKHKSEKLAHDMKEKHGGHDSHGHGGSEAGKKIEKAVGGTFAVGGGTGALIVEPGAGIAAAYGGPALGIKVAIAGLKFMAPFATILGFPHLLKWIVDKSVELAGAKVPAASKSGGHDDHGGGH